MVETTGGIVKHQDNNKLHTSGVSNCVSLSEITTP